MKKKGNGFLKWAVIIACVIVVASLFFGGGDRDSDDGEGIAAGGTELAAVEDAQGEPTEGGDEGEMASATIEEQVLMDQDGVVITATEYVTDDLWGDGIRLLLENNSERDVGIGCRALIVNDYMLTDLFSSKVAAGKKANETMYLSSTQLNAAGIENVGKVEIYFYAYDPDTYETLFDADCVTIETSAFAQMDTDPDGEDEGTELYAQDGIRIVGKAVDEESFWGTAILLYCENSSGRNVGINVENLSINGFMMDPIFSTTIYDGKKAIEDITILSSDLEDNGIEKIEDVEVSFHIYDADSYQTITDTDPIAFSAN